MSGIAPLQLRYGASSLPYFGIPAKRDAALDIERLRCLGEPAGGVTVEERGQRVAHPSVIGVEPGDFLVVEQFADYEGPVDRREGQRLEAQHLSPARGVVVAIPGLHDDEVLDADSVAAGLVIAGIVRDDHAGEQRP